MGPSDNTWLNPPEAYRDAFIKGYSRRNGQFMRNFYWSQPALSFGFASPEEPWMLPVDHPDVLALREELKRVLRFWMDMGASGFRADMAGALVKTAHGYINLPLGNHDLSRLSIERSTDDLEIIYAFSLTMPGIPFIFQGNEIGMRQLHDMPYVEGAYKPRAGGRSPMQWSRGPNLGFSNADPSKLYLPVDSAPDAPNVAEQEVDPRSLLNRVRRLIRLKKTETALKAYAEFVPVYAKPDTYPFVYARANGDAAVLVVLNPAERGTKATFTLRPAARGHELLAGRAATMEYAAGRYRLTVPGRSFAVYRIVR